MFTFANPWLLWAFPALLLPWIFRRRQQDQIQHVSFPLMDFLREAEERDFINPQLQEWLLLLLRTLLLALLILALAGPRWNASPGLSAALFSFLPYAGSLQQQTIVVDASYSMGALDGESTRWQQAADAYSSIRSQSSEVLSKTAIWQQGEDSTRLVSQEEAEALFLETPEQSGGTVDTLLEQLTPRMTDAERLVLITDGQRWPWEALLQSDAAMVPPMLVVSVGADEVANAWVSVDAQSSFPWGIAGWETLAGSVASYGALGESQTTLTMFKPESGEQLIQQPIPLPSQADSDIRIPFSHTLQLPEWMGSLANESRASFDVTVMIEANDALAFDDQLETTIPLVEQFRIGLFGDPDAGDENVNVLRASFQLWQGEGEASALMTDVLRPGSTIPTDTDLVLLSKRMTPWWTPVETSTLLEFVRQGGSAIVFTGGDDTPAWTALEAELGWTTREGGTPATVQVSGAGALAEALRSWDASAWDAWLPESHGSSSVTDARPWVTYANGNETASLLSEVPYGLGRVWLVNTDLSIEQGSLLSPLFPVVIWELSKHTVRRTDSFSATPMLDRIESNLQPLSADDKQYLTETHGIQFVSIDEYTSGSAPSSGSLDFRLWLLTLCAIVALVESWLANRLASM